MRRKSLHEGGQIYCEECRSTDFVGRRRGGGKDIITIIALYTHAHAFTHKASQYCLKMAEVFSFCRGRTISTFFAQRKKLHQEGTSC